MAAKKRRVTVKKAKTVKSHRHTKHSHTGYHPAHVAMLYRLGGAGIVIVAGTVIIFLVKVTFSL